MFNIQTLPSCLVRKIIIYGSNENLESAKMTEPQTTSRDYVSPLARLFQIAREKGYITYDEILAEIPQPEQTLDQLERLFGALLAAEIPFGDEGDSQPE